MGEDLLDDIWVLDACDDPHRVAWNTDATRMHYHMHSAYLRQLFLHNGLATGKYEVSRRPVAVSDSEYSRISGRP